VVLALGAVSGVVKGSPVNTFLRRQNLTFWEKNREFEAETANLRLQKMIEEKSRLIQSLNPTLDRLSAQAMSDKRQYESDLREVHQL
jgi:Na+/glutamate symporter